MSGGCKLDLSDFLQISRACFSEHGEEVSGSIKLVKIFVSNDSKLPLSLVTV
jgi:hypothetical protein